MLVSLVEGTLGLHHASQPEISRAFTGLLRVFVDTPHALVTHVQSQANDLRSLGEKGASLNHVVMVEFGSSGVFIQFERAVDVTEVVVFVLQESRNHFGQVLLVQL